MFSKKIERLKNPSSWRKIAIASWKTPNDPTVYGKLSVDFSMAKTFLEEANKKSAEKITVTHLVARALALTLKHFPDINGIIRWKRIYLRKTVDIFFQVALPPEGPDEKPDLSGVTVESCEDKSLEEIAVALVEKSRNLRLKKDSNFKMTLKLLDFVPALLLPWLLRLVSFVIYNLGFSAPRFGIPDDPFGSAMVTSVGMFKMPPGFAPLVPVSRVPLIVCVGEVKDKPWVVDGSVVARPVLDLTVTFDHRFIDGLTGSQMAHFFREIIEDPAGHLA